MGESRLSLDEQRLIRHQFYQVQHQLDEWVRLTASILAQALQSAAVITQPRSDDARLKHFELLSLYEYCGAAGAGAGRWDRAAGAAPARPASFAGGVEPTGVAPQRAVAGSDGSDSRRVRPDGLRTSTRPICAWSLESLVRMLAQLDVLTSDAFYHEGISQLLQRDEFMHADRERIRKVVEAIEQNSFCPSIAPQVMAWRGRAGDHWRRERFRRAEGHECGCRALRREGQLAGCWGSSPPHACNTAGPSRSCAT